MLFKTQLVGAMNGKNVSIENIMDDYSENENGKEGQEAESKLTKSLEAQKWLIAFDFLNKASLTFSQYISSAGIKGLPSVSFEIETPPPDFNI